MLARRAALVVLAIVTIAGAAPRARAGDGVALVRFAPDDSTLFVAIDVAGARDAPLFAKGLATVTSMAPAEVAALRAAGVDPATAFDTLAIGNHGWQDGDGDDTVLVLEGPHLERVAALIAAAPGARAGQHHGVTYWTYGDKPVALALIKRRLVCARPTRIAAMIDVALGKRPGAARSRNAGALRAIIAATDTRQDLWAAIVVPPAQADAARQAGFELEGVSVGATLSDHLAIEVKALTGSDASAQALDAQLAEALPKVTQGLGGVGLGGAADTLQIDRDGATVRATISLTEGEIRTVVDVVGGAIGMAFGAP